MDLYKKAISPTALSETQSDELRQRANSRVVALMRTGMTAEKAKSKSPRKPVTSLARHRNQRPLASITSPDASRRWRHSGTPWKRQGESIDPRAQTRAVSGLGNQSDDPGGRPQITHSDPEAVPVENILSLLSRAGFRSDS